MGEKQEYYSKDGQKKITIEDAGSDSGGIVVVVLIIAAITIVTLLFLFLFFTSPLIGGIALLVMLHSKGWIPKNQKLIAAWIVLTLIVPSVYNAFSSSFHEFDWLKPVIQTYYPLAGIGILGVLGWIVFGKKIKGNLEKIDPVK